MLPESVSAYYVLPGLLVLATPLLLHFTRKQTSTSSKLLRDTDTPINTMPHTVVVLGAGLAGITIAHHLLKHTPAVKNLRLIMVSPNDAMYWNFASVRGILPDQFTDDKLFYPFATAFSKYGDKFRHVAGYASKVDLDGNSVTVALGEGSAGEETLQYDTLIIATGTSFNAGMPFKNLASTAATKTALHAWQAAISAAKTIVVAGAGSTGVEVAGELAHELGASKTITLVSDGPLPFADPIKKGVREAAARELASAGVRLLPNTRVIASSHPATDGSGAPPRGPTTLTLQSGGKQSTLAADLYLPTTGVTFNTSFLPTTLLAPTGQVHVSPTLQLPGHANVFALGDVADAQPPQGVYADAQVRHLAPVLQTYLAGGGKAALPPYKADAGVMFAATVGRARGTGQAGSWRLWGWLVAYLKGRYLGTDYASQLVGGERTVQAKKW